MGSTGTTGSVRYGDGLISYTVRTRSERKVQRIAIHVEPDGRVLIDAPVGVTDAAVQVAVKKRARWISRHQAAIKARLAHVLPREYVSGESLLYMGRRYRLKVVLDQQCLAQVRLRAGYIEVTAPGREPQLVRAALDGWFRAKAKEMLRERLTAVAEPLRWVEGLPPVRFQAMKVQWGSCSPSGRLTLNPHLVKAPRECIDYVLLHELCHLRHHDHSAKFYQTLDSHMPGWRTVKERLDGMAEAVLAT